MAIERASTAPERGADALYSARLSRAPLQFVSSRMGVAKPITRGTFPAKASLKNVVPIVWKL
jgi:hypothetical protein